MLYHPICAQMLVSERKASEHAPKHRGTREMLLGRSVKKTYNDELDTEAIKTGSRSTQIECILQQSKEYNFIAYDQD